MQVVFVDVCEVVHTVLAAAAPAECFVSCPVGARNCHSQLHTTRNGMHHDAALCQYLPNQANAFAIVPSRCLTPTPSNAHPCRTYPSPRTPPPYPKPHSTHTPNKPKTNKQVQGDWPDTGPGCRTVYTCGVLALWCTRVLLQPPNGRPGVFSPSQHVCVC